MASVRLPSGAVLENVPEGATKRTILAELNRQFTPPQVAALLTPQGTGPAPPGRTPYRQAAETAIIGLGRGFTDIAEGAKQLALEVGEATGLAPEGAAQAYTRQVQAERDIYQRTPVAQSLRGRGYRTAGAMIPWVWAGLPGTTLPARIGAEALIGGAEGATQFVPEGESRAGQAARAAATAAGVTGTLGGLTRVTQRYRAGPQGAAQEIIQAGEREGVPVFAPDLPGRPGQIPATLGENLPFGMRPPREAQRTAAQVAAERMAQQAEQAAEAIPYGGARGLEPLQEVATGGGPRATSAAARIAETVAAEGDLPRIVQASGNVKLERAKLAASRLYDRVTARATNAGATVEPQATRAAIERVRSEMAKSAVRQPQLTRLLDDLADGLSTPRTFDELRATRSDVLATIRDAQRGVGEQVGTKVTGALQAVERAVERDLEQAAQASGEGALAAFRKASRFYRQRVVPLQERTLRRSLESQRADEIIGQYIQTGKADRARNFVRSLDRKGRAAVQATILRNVYDKATRAGEDAFSPARWAQEVERLAKPIGAVFEGADAQRIEGFRRLMRAIQRSGAIQENPSTGARSLAAFTQGLPVIGAVAGAPAGPAGALTTAGAVYGAEAATGAGIRALMTTSPGRKVLLALQRAGDEELPALVERAIAIASRGAAMEAGGP